MNAKQFDPSLTSSISTVTIVHIFDEEDRATGRVNGNAEVNHGRGTDFWDRCLKCMPCRLWFSVNCSAGLGIPHVYQFVIAAIHRIAAENRDAAFMTNDN